MYIIVNELDTVISQTISVTKKEMVLSVIRPYLYIHNITTGDLKVSIEKDASEITSFTQTITAIKAGLKSDNTYYHGFIKFQLASPIRLSRGDYVIKLSGVNGYSFASDSFIGWVKEYEDRTNNVTSTISSLNSPHSVQLWSLI